MTRVLPRSRAAGFERQQGCAQSGSPTTLAEIQWDAKPLGASRSRVALLDLCDAGAVEVEGADFEEDGRAVRDFGGGGGEFAGEVGDDRFAIRECGLVESGGQGPEDGGVRAQAVVVSG